GCAGLPTRGQALFDAPCSILYHDTGRVSQCQVRHWENPALCVQPTQQKAEALADFAHHIVVDDEKLINEQYIGEHCVTATFRIGRIMIHSGTISAKNRAIPAMRFSLSSRGLVHASSTRSTSWILVDPHLLIRDQLTA